MNIVNVILSGLGGQGILFMTRVLAQAALDQKIPVRGAETHGMAQRGGSVVSHLRLGSTENSLINTGSAHFLLALEENEAYRNLPFVAESGKIMVNMAAQTFPRPEIRPYLAGKDITCRTVPASRLAMGLDAPRSANLAMIGFMAAWEDCPLKARDIRATVERISPEPYRSANLKVFDAGFQWAGQAERPL